MGTKALGMLRGDAAREWLFRKEENFHRALGRHPGYENCAGTAEICSRVSWFLSEMWARQGVVRLPR